MPSRRHKTVEKYLTRRNHDAVPEALGFGVAIGQPQQEGEHQMQKTMIQEAAVIDYPEQNEKVTAPSYTFRIGAVPEALTVEISIDERGWQACRPAVGYWWYDWSGYAAGRHELQVRARLADGRIVAAEPRDFAVEFKPAGKKSLLSALR
jgi:hypothetical protein